jgi:Flp pilus assembly protein TadG
MAAAPGEPGVKGFFPERYLGATKDCLVFIILFGAALTGGMVPWGQDAGSTGATRDRTMSRPLFSSFRKALRHFGADRRGNVALMFGLAVIPLVGAVAVGVDYTRANTIKARLQAAADAAVLAAARDFRATTPAQRQRVAEQVFAANLDASMRVTNPTIRVTQNDTGIRANVAANTPTEFMKLLGRPTMQVAAMAEAAINTDVTEIALVLDNTGSMRNDMNTLREAAADLVEQVMIGQGDQVKIGVVPYVASVNPGRAALPMAYMDTNADSRWHGVFFEHRQLGRITNPGCRYPWEVNPPVAGGPGGPGGPGPAPDPGPSGGDRTDFFDPLKSFAGLVNELFGIRAASAQSEVTPNTRTPLGGTTIAPWGALLPPGFNHWNDCGLYNPDKVSHFDLFARIPNARWKGCVEARPEPFDIDDTAPDRSRPDTLFVPYFFPDQSFPGNADQGNGQGPFANNYMRDGDLPPGWSFTGDWERQYNLFKYNGVNTATIRETPPRTLGPNAGCPDEVLPLTADKQRVLSRIRTLSHWDSGGTMTSEGMAWGWRVLSPGAPFTEGRPYARDVRKIIILMTDGRNSLIADDNPGGAHKSDYTAYGHLREGRMGGTDRYDRSEAYLNERTRQVCASIQGQNITVYSIIFREGDSNTRTMIRGCATSPQHYFVAENQGQLRDVFRAIAGDITKLRLTR